ncbi:kinetochore-associated protein 1-like [Crassostrea virginica]
MPWDIVSSDFGGDETVNFGPREESGSALYQIDTFATISSQEKETKVPHIVSSVVGELAFLSVDQHVSMFTDFQHTTTLAYDAVIEELALSPDGQVMILGDSSGRLHILDTETSKMVFSHIVTPRNRMGNSFSRIKCFDAEEGLYTLFVLTTSGDMKILRDFNKETFLAGGDGIKAVLKEKLISIKVDNLHSSVTDLVYMKDNFITLGSGEGILGVWEWEDGQPVLGEEIGDYLLSASQIVQGKVTSDEKFLFSLDSQNNLCLWSTQAWFILKQWTEIKVKEFQLLETREVQNQGLQDMRLALITQAVEGHCTLMIQSLPSFQNIYNLQLNAPCFIAECLPLQDNIFVAECCPDEGCPGSVSTVRFRCLTETNPETRLYRILSKKKFEEAVMFAKLYNLEITMVYKVRVNYLLEQLSPWNVKKHSSDDVSLMVEQLWECLQYVKEELDLLENCMNSALPTLTLTQQMLTLCRKLLMEFPDKSSEAKAKSKQQSLLAKLNEISRRLNTYHMAYGSSQYSADNWEHFRRADLLQEALQNMRMGNLSVGLTIWVQHQAEWERVLKPSIMDAFLSYIPEKVRAVEILGILRESIVPYIIRVVPEKLESLITWVIRKATNLELMEKSAWPVNGLDFMRSIYSCLCQYLEIHYTEEKCDQSDLVSKMKINISAVLEPVKKLITNLQHLYDLHHKYKCYLTFGQFLAETTESVTFRMLDNVVALELIQTRLTQQIRPYMKEHHLKEDVVFTKYVKDLLERSMGMTSFYGEAPWEAKVIAVISCIKDPKSKCEAIMETMKMARIPLSAQIEKLIQDGMELEHPKATEIQEQYKMVTVRKLVLKYGVNRVPDKEDSQRLIKYILLQDKPDSVQDALSVMEAYGNQEYEQEIYLFKCRDLIHKNKLHECMNLLRQCPAHLTLACCRDLIGFITLSLKAPVISDEKVCLLRRQYQCEAGIYLIKFTIPRIQDRFEVKEMEELLCQLKNIHALLKEFSIYLPLDQYTKPEVRRKTLSNRNNAEALRLAEILQVSKIEMEGEFMIEAARRGEIKEALQVCRKLLDSDPSEATAEIFYKVALVLQETLAESGRDTEAVRILPRVTHQLVCQAMVMCSPSLLPRLIALSKVTSLCRSVDRQCEAPSAVQDELWEDMGDPKLVDRDWRINDAFQDEALVMNSQFVLPIITKYAMSDPGITATDAHTKPELTALKQSVLPILQVLKDNSHHLLALQFALHMTFTAMETIVPMTKDQENPALHQLIQQSYPYIREFTAALLMKVFNCQEVDHRLALALFINRPKNEALKMMMSLIKSSGHKYKKLQAMGNVGIGIGQLNREASVIEMCEKLKKNATWGHRLSKVKINFSDVFGNPDSEKRMLLPQLVQCEATSVALIKDFCREFRLDEDEALMLYLDHIFVTSDSPLNTPDSPLNGISKLDKARIAIREISAKDALMKKLVAMYSKTDSYDYETLAFLLNEMQRLEIQINQLHPEKVLLLLNYLTVYKRKAEPSKYEIQYRSGDNRDELQIMECLPPASRTRLPFHPLVSGEPWKIITPELTKETVATWLNIAPLLHLDRDQLYLMTINNMVKRHVQVVKRSGHQPGSSAVDKAQWNWEMKEANTELLCDVQVLLKKVSNCETALVCAKWMMAELPLGAEKVLALRGCLSLAELWFKSLPDDDPSKEKARGAYKKFLGAYQRLATEQILFVNKVGDPELVQLAGNPLKLIPKLYEHRSITQTDPGLPRPDIHKVAQEIAAVTNTDLHKVRLTLISQWLPSSASKQADGESTVTFNFENLKLAEQSMMSDAEDEHINLKRVLYLLQQGSTEENVTFLLNFVFENQNAGEMVSVTNMCKMRALHCLLELRKDEVVQKMCGRTIEELRNLLKTTSYLIALEKLHVLHSVETFESSNKEGLIKGIWRNHSHQKSASMLVAALCLDYKVYDTQIWNGVLQQLVHFGLMEQLEYVLGRLNAAPEVWQAPVFSKAWRTMLVTPLTKVMAPLTEDQLDTCVHIFNLISRCPVLSDTDIVSVLMKLYLKLELPLCALASLFLSDNSQTERQEILGQHKLDLLKDSDRLMKHGMIAVVIKKVEEAVFQYLLSTEDFQDISVSPLSKSFFKFAVENNNIDGILQFAVRHKKIKEAVTLLKMLCSHNSLLSKRLESYREESMLKKYLEMQGLAEVSSMI